MLIYILYLIFILFSALVLASKNHAPEQCRKRFIIITFVGTFLLYALRASSVGRDLIGYEAAYLSAGHYDWFDFDYIYFESGYIFLMKICSALGLSFQGFMAVVNAIILIPIFVAIAKFSNRPFLSVITYICYTYFEFNMTGIRQALASSVVLIGTMSLTSRRYSLLKYVLLTILASLFHRGALVALLYVPFHYMSKQKNYSLAIVGASILLWIFRTPLMVLIKLMFEKDSMNAYADVYIGLNFIFLIVLGIVFFIAARNREIRLENRNLFPAASVAKPYGSFAVISDKMFFLSIGMLLLFGSDVTVRSHVFLNQVIIIKTANFIDECVHKDSKRIVEFGMVAFLVVYFFLHTLLPNNFDIVPYMFFWQT